jgi:hypothetical protein
MDWPRECRGLFWAAEGRRPRATGAATAGGDISGRKSVQAGTHATAITEPHQRSKLCKSAVLVRA